MPKASELTLNLAAFAAIFFILALGLSLQICFCLSNQSLEAKDRLDASKLLISEMEKNNFSVQRPMDIYTEASEIYKAQVALEQANGTPDYTLIYKRADEISNISSQAFNLSDELNALNIRLNESDVNTTESRALYDSAIQEFRDERYDVAEKRVSEAYDKLFELESSQSRIAAFYASVSDTFGSFLERNQVYIISGLAVFIVFLIIARKKIQTWILKKRLHHLEVKKKILFELIAKAQKEYFDKKALGEDTYKIKISKFEELVRDLDRQIPLVKEELEKVKPSENTARQKVGNHSKSGY